MNCRKFYGLTALLASMFLFMVIPPNAALAAEFNYQPIERLKITYSLGGTTIEGHKDSRPHHLERGGVIRQSQVKRSDFHY